MIIDSYLPGTDCFDLAMGIHNLGGCAGLPLMVLSSGGQPGDGERCRVSGVSAYLSKPLSRITAGDLRLWRSCRRNRWRCLLPWNAGGFRPGLRSRIVHGYWWIWPLSPI